MALVERVELVGRDASARAGETEQLRHLPDDIAAALRDTGMCRAWVPDRLAATNATWQAERREPAVNLEAWTRE